MTQESHESNLALIRAAQQGDGVAMDRLVRENAALVKFVAKRYLNRGREFDDLYQLGCLGLVKAIKNFNTDFDVRFSTYAVPVILGEIRRYLRDDGLLRVSRSIKENAARIRKAVEESGYELGREPTLEELSQKLLLTREEILLAMDSGRSARSLSEPLSEDGQLTLADTLGEDETGKLDDRLELDRLLNSLPEDQRTLLIRRYIHEHTQSQIAKDMGISQVQVSRLESRILKRLREQVG